MRVRSCGEADSKELKFQEGSEVTGEEGGKAGATWVSDSQVLISCHCLSFLKTQALNPGFPLLFRCTSQFSPYHWWNGERQRKAGDLLVGVEAQRVATVPRATDKDQGRSSPTPGKGSVLPAVSSLPRKPLFPSPGSCHWTLAQAL